MSHGILAYAVDAEALREALGARDEALVEALGRRYEPELAACDRALPGDVPAVEALRDVVLGRAWRPRAGALYHRVIMLLCDRFGGEPLPGASLRHCDQDLLGRLLEAAAWPPDLRGEDLAGRGSPVPGVPAPVGLPATGWLEPARCAALDERLATHTLGPGALHVLPDPAWAREALRELEGWLGTCADLGRGLATFYD